MLEREVWEAVNFWPASAWPLLLSSILYALFRLNKANESAGILYFHIYKGVGKFFILFYPAATIFDTLINFYMLYVVGWTYLLNFFLIIGIFGPLIIFIVGVTPYSQYVFPSIYIGIAASFLTLMNIVSFDVFLDLNAAIYTWLIQFWI